MAAALLITLRETLEASLVVGIVLAFLHRSEYQRYDRVVWWAVAAGVGASMLLAWLFNAFLGGFEGRTEEIFEGITMLAAAGLITWMILWMMRQGARMRSHIETQVETHVESEHPLGIFLLVFASVIREGIETVIFLRAAFLQSQAAMHNLGAVLGIVLAISASWLLFKGMKFFSLRTFFTATSVLLILFAAGLVAHGIHELEEAGIIPIVVEHLWDTNAILDERGTVGSLLKGVFGYNGNPSLLEMAGYVLFLCGIGFAWRRIQKTA